MLDIFALRNQIIDDYHRYIDSFLNIRDRKYRTRELAINKESLTKAY